MFTVSKTITAENQFSGAFTPPQNPRHPKVGRFTLAITGTGWSATVTLQRSFDKGDSWEDVDTFSTNTQVNIEDLTDNIRYRVGVKTDDFGSGTLTAKFAK